MKIITAVLLGAMAGEATADDKDAALCREAVRNLEAALSSNRIDADNPQFESVKALSTAIGVEAGIDLTPCLHSNYTKDDFMRKLVVDMFGAHSNFENVSQRWLGADSERMREAFERPVIEYDKELRQSVKSFNKTLNSTPQSGAN